MLRKINFKKIAMVSVLVVAIVFIYLFVAYQGAVAYGVTPFGGQIKSVFYCVNGVRLTVGPPVGGQFMYSGGTLYRHYQIYRVGPWTLGEYSPGAVCTVCGTSGCVNIPATGYINQVGTSI